MRCQDTGEMPFRIRGLSKHTPQFWFLYCTYLTIAFFSLSLRVLMADLSEDMTNEDLNNVKFLLSTKLSREKQDKAKVKL